MLTAPRRLTSRSGSSLLANSLALSDAWRRLRLTTTLSSLASGAMAAMRLMRSAARLVGFAAGGAVANGDQVHAVRGHQAAQRVQ